MKKIRLYVLPTVNMLPCFLTVFTQTINGQSNGLLTIPVGTDAYRMWYKWPQQRIGVRAYMRSTYDRLYSYRSPDFHLPKSPIP